MTTSPHVTASPARVDVHRFAHFAHFAHVLLHSLRQLWGMDGLELRDSLGLVVTAFFNFLTRVHLVGRQSYENNPTRRAFNQKGMAALAL